MKFIASIKKAFKDKGIEIVINTTCLSDNKFYEFVVDDTISVVDFGRLSANGQEVFSLDESELKNKLFELNHVRVNLKRNNHVILTKLHNALVNCGVTIHKPDTPITAKFKPLGELSHTVRFYVKAHGELVFLSEAVKLRAV